MARVVHTAEGSEGAGRGPSDVEPKEATLARAHTHLDRPAMAHRECTILTLPDEVTVRITMDMVQGLPTLHGLPPGEEAERALLLDLVALKDELFGRILDGAVGQDGHVHDWIWRRRAGKPVGIGEDHTRDPLIVSIVHTHLIELIRFHQHVLCERIVFRDGPSRLNRITTVALLLLLLVVVVVTLLALGRFEWNQP